MSNAEDTRAGDHSSINEGFDPEAFVREAAPTTGHGKEARKAAERIARTLAPHLHKETIFRFMSRHWSDRCDPPWSAEDLMAFAREAKQPPRKIKRESELPTGEALIEKEPYPDGRPTNAELAQKLGISTRRFYQIRRNGTAIRAHAEKLAAAFGGSAENYLRTPNQQRNQRYLVRTLMRIGAREFPFRIFAEEWELTFEPADDFIAEYRRLNDMGIAPDDFADFEELSDFARRLNLDVAGIWPELKRWRIASVTALALDEINAP